MGLPDRWDACSRTIFLEGEPSAFAHWGNTIAVGLESNIVLLDAITGIRTSVLFGHTDTISSLAFSLDGTLLVSISNDLTVELWDVRSGGIVQKTFGGEPSTVSAVSISLDGTTIAFGTKDGAICLWDVWTGHLIELHQDSEVTIISLSPIDSRRLLSSSCHGTVQQWDADGRQIGTFHHKAHRVEDLAYASDGTRFVSCGGTVAAIRDSESGAVVAELEAPDQTPLYRCCFSPDGRFVACAADTRICVWDITISGPHLVGCLIGHSDAITSLAFTPSLVSGSWDQSVKFWPTGNILADPTTNYTAALHSSAQIVSINLFAEDRIVVTSDEDGVVETWDLITDGCRSSSSTFSTPAEGEHDTHLAGDTLVIVWWTDEEMEYHVWDVYKDQLLRSFRSSLQDLKDLKISGDGSKIFGLGSNYIEVVSMQTGEVAGHVGFGSWGGSNFFVHGPKVGIRHSRSRVRDFEGPKVSDLGEFPDRPRLDLADWSIGHGITPRCIKDTVTGRMVFCLPERYMKPDTKLGWDGRYLLVRSHSGEVVIMDFDSVCPQ